MNEDKLSAKHQGLKWEEALIFERSREGKPGLRVSAMDVDQALAGRGLPEEFARRTALRLPEITEREAGTMTPLSPALSPAARAAARSPPCAPTPGASSQQSGARARTWASASGWVAPTTKPIWCASPQVCPSQATCRKSAPAPKCWMSAAEGLEV